MQININQWSEQLFDWDALPHFIVIHGSRASGKDYGVAIPVLLRMLRVRMKVMTVRQYQNSIADSIKSLFEDVIFELGLEDYFIISKMQIMARTTGSVIHFKGAERNMGSIRGWQGYDVCIINEASDISQAAFDLLKPTIRKQNSKIFIILNPKSPQDAIAKEFLGPDLKGFERSDALLIRVNYESNKFLSQTLLDHIEVEKQGDPLVFAHVYGGGYDLGSLANPFPYQHILAMTRDDDEGIGDEAWCSVDLAFTENATSDWTVCVAGDSNGNLTRIERFQTADIDVQIGRIKGFAGDLRTAIDSTAGGVVLARSLRNEGVKVTEVVWTTKLKSEMIRATSQMLSNKERRLTVPKDPGFRVAVDEMLHYEKTGANKFEAASGYNDDCVSAIMQYCLKTYKPPRGMGAV